MTISVVPIATFPHPTVVGLTFSAGAPVVGTAATPITARGTPTIATVVGMARLATTTYQVAMQTQIGEGITPSATAAIRQANGAP